MIRFLLEEDGAVIGRCVWAFILLGGPGSLIVALFALSRVLGG